MKFPEVPTLKTKLLKWRHLPVNEYQKSIACKCTLKLSSSVSSFAWPGDGTTLKDCTNAQMQSFLKVHGVIWHATHHKYLVTRTCNEKMMNEMKEIFETEIFQFW